MIMNSKNIATIDNNNSALGYTRVTLKDSSGAFFWTEITPLRAIDLNVFPEDNVKYILSFNQAYLGRANQVENYYEDSISSIKKGALSFYALQGVDVTSPLIYGYAGFKINSQKKCLEVAYLYKSYYLEKNTKYNIRGFGERMIGYGVFLNDQLYGKDTDNSLIASPIKWDAKPFYDKMNFTRSGLLRSTATLSRKAAQEKFNI